MSRRSRIRTLEGNCGLQADQLAYGTEGQPKTFVDVANTCPVAPTFLTGKQFRTCRAAPTLLAGMQFRSDKADQVKLQRKSQAIRTVRTRPGMAGLQPIFVLLLWETFGFTHPKSGS